MSAVLQYLFIEQTVVYSFITGLLILPVLFWMACLFGWAWQETFWRERTQLISELHTRNFVLSPRGLGPKWKWRCGTSVLVAAWRPWGDKMWVKTKEDKQGFGEASFEEALAFIDLHAHEGSTSKPQSS